MIQRTYAYSGKIYLGNNGDYRPFCGWVSVKSWFPHSSEAWEKCIEKQTESDGVEKKNVTIEWFARI